MLSYVDIVAVLGHTRREASIPPPSQRLHIASQVLIGLRQSTTLRT